MVLRTVLARTEQELRTLLKRRLPFYMVPTYIEFMTGFPTHAIGKVDKTKVQMLSLYVSLSACLSVSVSVSVSLSLSLFPSLPRSLPPLPSRFSLSTHTVPFRDARPSNCEIGMQHGLATHASMLLWISHGLVQHTRCCDTTSCHEQHMTCSNTRHTVKSNTRLAAIHDT